MFLHTEINLAQGATMETEIEMFDVNKVLRRIEKSALINQGLNTIEGGFAKAEVFEETDSEYKIYLTHGVNQENSVKNTHKEQIHISKVDFMIRYQ
jgi:hypothetical protein